MVRTRLSMRLGRTIRSKIPSYRIMDVAEAIGPVVKSQ